MQNSSTGFNTYSNYIEDCPAFLVEIPLWHQQFFSEDDRVYQPETKQRLQATLVALKQTSRILSICELCLLLFPYPRLEQKRQQFKYILGDAARLNSFKLHFGEVNNDFIFTKKWSDCLNEFVELETTLTAARKGWFYTDSFYVCIWQRYIEEKEKSFQKSFDSFTTQFQAIPSEYPEKANKQLKTKAQLEHAQWFIRYQQLRLEADKREGRVSDNSLFELMAEEAKRDPSVIRKAITRYKKS